MLQSNENQNGEIWRKGSHKKENSNFKEKEWFAFQQESPPLPRGTAHAGPSFLKDCPWWWVLTQVCRTALPLECLQSDRAPVSLCHRDGRRTLILPVGSWVGSPHCIYARFSSLLHPFLVLFLFLGYSHTWLRINCTAATWRMRRIIPGFCLCQRRCWRIGRWRGQREREARS